VAVSVRRMSDAKEKLKLLSDGGDSGGKKDK
jgi:hypothetical protein